MPLNSPAWQWFLQLAHSKVEQLLHSILAGAGKMAQQVKGLAAKPGNLSLIPEAHIGLHKAIL